MAKTFMRNGRRYFSDSGASVARWSAGIKIGRPLRDGEGSVHHGYKGKGCDDSDNLWVHKDHSEHMQQRHSKKKSSWW